MGGLWDSILGMLGGGGESGGGGMSSLMADPSSGQMGQVGQGMGAAGVDQGAIDAEKYKQFMNMYNSDSAQQGRAQHAASSANDKEFALTEGQRSYHDQFQAPMPMQGIAGMVQAFSPPQQPFKRGLRGFDILQELLGKR